MPYLGNLYKGNGFSLELKFTTDNIKKDQVLLDTRRNITEGIGSKANYAGNGLKISILKSGAFEFIMDDGRSPLIWTSGPGTIKHKAPNHLVINVDAKSKILTYVINGDLWDGGDRPFGYARFNPFMWDVNGEKQVNFASGFKGEVELYRVYNRCLFTSEAIGNYRSGK
jgi:hypothetical protein